MNDTQKQVQAILNELKQQIIYLVDQGQLDNVDFFMEQYIKLAPNTIERYSLEALINMGKENLKKANEILLEGAKHHPMSFDLLYNLGYTFQHLEEPLEAYHIYMKAKYVAEAEEEKEDIYKALKSLVDDFKGHTSADEEKMRTIIMAGDKSIGIDIKHKDLERRKELVHTLGKNLVKDSSTVLEIGFDDGAISKNLQFFGYEVTAVDPVKEKILNVIIKEWHDNILQPEQETAKYYEERTSLDWMQKIPAFDTIIALADGNIERLQARGHEKEILEQILEKSNKQTIIRVSQAASQVEFTKEDLEEVAKEKSLIMKMIHTEENDDGVFETYSLVKEVDQELFSIPSPWEIRDSRSIVLEVDISKCRDLYGAGYVDDFHPFAEVLREYQKNPELEYEDSILKKYYDTFQPSNLEEGLFARNRNVVRLKRGWIGYPWYWDKDKKMIFTDKINDTRPGGIHFFGPNTEEFGQGELERLKDLYDNLKEHGYNPEMFSDGYISGYLMFKGDDYRFVVTEGQHRIGALVALGYDEILCKFTQKPQYNQIVNLDEIKKWGQVENKVYSKNLATRVFWRFFEEGVGRDRMNFK